MVQVGRSVLESCWRKVDICSVEGMWENGTYPSYTHHNFVTILPPKGLVALNASNTRQRPDPTHQKKHPQI